MTDEDLIAAIAAEVRAKLQGEGSGHDWWHVHRVWKMAQRIGAEEAADMPVVSLGALLHDIADWKFHGGDDTVGPRVALEVLARHGVSPEIAGRVAQIVEEISFKGAGVPSVPTTLEGGIVQDADRLDAIGAIGIARAFAYGGFKGRALHEPGIAPVPHASKEAYAANQGPTINHFHEKLLLLKDRMNTAAGRALARERHRFMEEYLERFHKEWEAPFDGLPSGEIDGERLGEGNGGLEICKERLARQKRADNADGARVGDSQHRRAIAPERGKP